MKNIFTFCCLILVLSSCSEWKYSKGVKWEQPAYNRSKVRVAEQKNAPLLDLSKEDNLSPQDVSIGENFTQEKVSISTEELAVKPVGESSDKTSVTVLMKDDDSLQVVNQAIVDIALEAENQGRKSRNLGITGLILYFTYIFTLVGIVLSAIALSKGIKSLISRYNTPEGLRMAKTGVITSSITLGLFVLAIIFVAFIILLII